MFYPFPAYSNVKRKRLLSRILFKGPEYFYASCLTIRRWTTRPILFAKYARQLAMFARRWCNVRLPLQNTIYRPTAKKNATWKAWGVFRDPAPTSIDEVFTKGVDTYPVIIQDAAKAFAQPATGAPVTYVGPQAAPTLPTEVLSLGNVSLGLFYVLVYFTLMILIVDESNLIRTLESMVW